MKPTDEKNSDDASDDPSPDQPPSGHGQVLTPLFVLAFGLVALGYFLGLTTEADVRVDGPEREVSAPDDLAPEPVGLDEPGAQRATLRFRPHEEHRYIFEMKQTSTRRFLRGESEPLETRLKLEVVEDVEEARDGVLTMNRRYVASDVSARSSGEPVGPQITAQVEKLLADAEMEVDFRSNGQPVDFRWREVSNPQVRRALLLIRDAHLLVTPRFRRDAVNIGETWVYTVEISVERVDRGVVVRGGADVANKLVGFEEYQGRRIAVIEQEFDVDAAGEVDLPDGGQAAFEIEGAGSGTLRFDVHAGHVLSSDLAVERVLSIEQGDGSIDQTSDLEIRLQPVGTD